ncbi:MAG TPA: TetR/AcrR family transcriptional regulator [Rhizomicrobium sp.]|nr:TetR/AcrR family transcriptional regulator [Rhizomicrobium sp.]
MVQAAALLFAERGFESAAVADILERAGANSGSLYHFFGGKRDLLIEVLRRHRRDLALRLASPDLREISDPIDRVFGLLGSYRDALARSDCQQGCPIIALAIELRAPDPEVGSALAAYFDAWIDVVEGWFEESVIRSPQGYGARDLATLALAVLQGGVIEARVSRSVESFDRAISLLRLALIGLKRVAHDEVVGRSGRVPPRGEAPRRSRSDNGREILTP